MKKQLLRMFALLCVSMLDGRKLNGKPTQPGVYINGGKKVVIK